MLKCYGGRWRNRQEAQIVVHRQVHIFYRKLISELSLKYNEQTTYRLAPISHGKHRKMHIHIDYATNKQNARCIL